MQVKVSAPASHLIPVRPGTNLGALGGTVAAYLHLPIRGEPPVARLNLGFDPIAHDPSGGLIYVGPDQKFCLTGIRKVGLPLGGAGRRRSAPRNDAAGRRYGERR